MAETVYGRASVGRSIPAFRTLLKFRAKHTPLARGTPRDAPRTRESLAGVQRRRAAYSGNRKRIENIEADIAFGGGGHHADGPSPTGTPGSAVLRSASAGSLASAGLLLQQGSSARRCVSPQGRTALGWVLDTHSHLEEVRALRRSHSPVSRQRLRDIASSERGLVGGVGAPYRAAAMEASRRGRGRKQERSATGYLDTFNSSKLGASASAFF